MIPTLLACLVGQSSAGPVVVEGKLPLANATCIEAIVRAGDLSNKEMSAFIVLGKSLLLGTNDFTSRQIYDYGSQSGYEPTVTIFGDWMRIRLIAPAGGVIVATSFLESMVKAPSLETEEVQDVIKATDNDRLSDWEHALQPIEFDAKITPNLVKNLHQKLFRFPNVTFWVAGPEATSAKQEIEERFRGFRPPRERPIYPDKPVKTRLRHDGGLSTIEFRSQPFAMDDGPKLCAAFLLGVGKGGVLHRELRERKGWTYRQEALLTPSSAGWRLRLLAGYAAFDSDDERFAQVKAVIADAIPKLDEKDLVRAKAMARASLLRGLPNSPFWLTPDGPAGMDFLSDCDWGSTAYLMGRPNLTRADLVNLIDAVKLEDARAAALQLFDQANGIWIKGH